MLIHLRCIDTIQLDLALFHHLFKLTDLDLQLALLFIKFQLHAPNDSGLRNCEVLQQVILLLQFDFISFPCHMNPLLLGIQEAIDIFNQPVFLSVCE